MTNKFFENKTAVVSGGRSGIGAAMCERLRSNGALVISLDLYVENANTINDSYLEINCDVTDETSLKEAFAQIKQKFTKIDFLCVNAGIVPNWSKSSETSIETWSKVMNINVIGAALTLKHAINLMNKPGGSILFTGSLNSWKGDGNIASYVASKHAILGIIKSSAMELGVEGIRVNGIAPGPIATDALVERVRNRSQNNQTAFNEAMENLKNSTALKRIATVEEVVNLAEFLLSNKASGITGQLVSIDCGIL